MTVQGAGASLSPAIRNWVAGLPEYRLAFHILGGVALIFLALWFGLAGILRPACAANGDTRRTASS